MSATWYGVAVTVEVAFTDSASVALGSCTWTDITSDVRAVSPVSVVRGRNNELSQTAPGTMTLTLDNRARAYDPSNTAGAHYGYLLPRRRIRVKLAGTAIFTGYTTGWFLEYPADGTDAIVTVPCVDAFDVLSSSDLPGSAYAAEVLADDPINYWPMQEAVGEDLTDLVDPTGDLKDMGPFGVLESESVADLTLPIGATSARIGAWRNPYTASLTTPAAIDMWCSTVADADTNYGEVIRAASSSDFFSIQAATELAGDSGAWTLKVVLRYSHGGKTDSAAGGTTIVRAGPIGSAFHLAAVSNGTTITVYLNGVSIATDTLAAGSWTYGSVTRAQVYTSETKALSHVACYSTALSAARVAAHYEAGLSAYGHPRGERGGARIGRILDAADWPTADRDLSTGDTVLDTWLPAGGDALTACRAVETTEQGLFFVSAAGKPTFRSRQDFATTTRCATSQATFGDGVGEVPIETPLRIDGAALDYLRNVVTVSYGDTSVTTRDATSVAAYGSADDSVSTLIAADGGFVARQLAAFRLRLRKDPATRIPAVSVQPHNPTAGGSAATHVATLVGLELGDRVTVNRRPSGGTGTFSQACTIQGIRWSISPSFGFRWSAYLAPVQPSYTAANYLVMGDANYGLIGPAHVALPGTSGSYLSVPDDAPLDITGDIELVCRARATDWTPAGGLDFGAKWGGTQQSWQWSHMPAGTMRFRYSPDGTTTNSDTSTVAMTATDGAYLWLKVTLDVNNGAGGRDVKFYTAADATTEPTSWTQLGSTVTTAGTTSIFSGSSIVAIGSASNGTGNMFNGSVARFIVRNGIGGTTVLDFDASKVTTHAQSTVADQSSNAATITANGSAVLHPANVLPY